VGRGEGIAPARGAASKQKAELTIADRISPSVICIALKRDRVGQHSIRINDRWRICFTWRDGNPHDVEIMDYH